ncbi:MAG: hypothetical protein J3K34DRAFT_421646 [Monoraphidium minutum]|nr:MAG: hypothetical protein J3K34DRAFT_421646 [Monoraphidium minutum]
MRPLAARNDWGDMGQVRGGPKRAGGGVRRTAQARGAAQRRVRRGARRRARTEARGGAAAGVYARGEWAAGLWWYRAERAVLTLEARHAPSPASGVEESEARAPPSEGGSEGQAPRERARVCAVCCRGPAAAAARVGGQGLQSGVGRLAVPGSKVSVAVGCGFVRGPSSLGGAPRLSAAALARRGMKGG